MQDQPELYWVPKGRENKESWRINPIPVDESYHQGWIKILEDLGLQVLQEEG